jgi:hypothetical protein
MRQLRTSGPPGGKLPGASRRGLKELQSLTVPVCLFDQTHPSFGASAPNQRSEITFFRV